MRIIIGSDHGGFELKEDLKKFLKESGHEVRDMGCPSEDPVDYPDIAFLVAQTVQSNPDSLGIVIDRVGSPSAMTANKIPGIRASVCWDIFTARTAREHNNANILALGGWVIGKGLAREVVMAFIETPFAGGRHERRVTKMMEIEAKYIRRV